MEIKKQDFIAIRGFYGNIALVDSSTKKITARLSLENMLEKGYYKEAVFAAFFNNDPQEQDIVVNFFSKTQSTSPSFFSLARAFGLQKDILYKIKKLKKV